MRTFFTALFALSFCLPTVCSAEILGKTPPEFTAFYGKPFRESESWGDYVYEAEGRYIYVKFGEDGPIETRRAFEVKHEVYTRGQSLSEAKIKELLAPYGEFKPHGKKVHDNYAVDHHLVSVDGKTLASYRIHDEDGSYGPLYLYQIKTLSDYQKEAYNL